jgi:hypothetical protein
MLAGTAVTRLLARNPLIPTVYSAGSELARDLSSAGLAEEAAEGKIARAQASYRTSLIPPFRRTRRGPATPPYNTAGPSGGSTQSHDVTPRG